MPKEDRKARRNSISMVGPYARIRVIAAVVIFVFAVVVIAYRSITG